MISRSNYEEYFLDYHDGSLDASRLAELREFLANNPDLKEEFESFMNVVLEDDSDKIFTGKENLKKPVISLKNYKTWFIASVENDLTEEKKHELDRFLEVNPSLKPEFEIFKRTKVYPDKKIVFSNKHVLKRGGKVLSFSAIVYRAIAVAASIILLIASYLIFRNQDGDKPMMSEEKRIPIEQKMANAGDKPNSSQTDKKVRDKKVEKSPKHNVVQSNPNTILASGKKPVIKNNTHDTLRKNQDNAILQPGENLVENTPVQSKDQSQLNAEKIENKSNLQENNFSNSSKVNTLQLSDVFDEAEMKEFNLDKLKLTENKPNALLAIVQTGAEKLGKATGTNIDIQSHEDIADNSKTFALAVGSFSVTRRSVK